MMQLIFSKVFFFPQRDFSENVSSNSVRKRGVHIQFVRFERLIIVYSPYSMRDYGFGVAVSVCPT